MTLTQREHEQHTTAEAAQVLYVLENTGRASRRHHSLRLEEPDELEGAKAEVAW